MLDVRPDRRQVLLTTAGAGAVMLASPLNAAADQSASFTLGRAQPFDLGWRFHLGAGEGLEAPGLDDSGWRSVDLPHDWSIEDLPPQTGPTHRIGPFDSGAEGGTATGFTVGGEGWYRKRFRLAPPAGARVEILFEGVYMASDVWVNGHHLGLHPSGYTPFAYDLTPFLSSGDNLIAVRVHNLGRNSRWYPGSGIYRHVWLDVLPQAARIGRWGVGVATERITPAAAKIAIDTRLEDLERGLTLVSRIRDAAGATVWEAAAPAEASTRQSATIASPHHWSPKNPVLYSLETELRRGTVVIDRNVADFGVRIITFDVATGMAVNGAPTKLRGGCIHHDNGLLGAAAFDAAEDRKVRLLKARGFNAVRPSHNPFSAAFLSACDRHGVMVVAETFDAWRSPKLPQDYSVYFEDQWRADLTTMVLSARNHPSVIMWSIGNEIPDRNLPSGVETQWKLANLVHELDPTRPVTAAINDFQGRLVTPSGASARPGREGLADQTSTVFLDIVGFNYKIKQYEADHQRFPNRIAFGTESFPKDIFAIWELTDRTPHLLGDFVWTAMDYLGEAGVGGSTYTSHPGGMGSMSAWPYVVSDCGDIDLIGEQKAASLARDVVWDLSPLEICVQKPPPEDKVEVTRPWGWLDARQSWTWPGAVGKALAVQVYTAGDRIDLRLNGVTLESRAVTPADLKQLEFKVSYAPGVLEAVAFRDGAQIARRRLTTAGEAAAVRLTPERSSGGSGRGDVVYVAVEIVDAQGNRVPDLNKPLQITVAGPAELVGFGSANPFAVGGFQSPVAQTWDGRALAILRGRGRSGRVRVEVHGDGLKGGFANLRLA